jgi:hypothetical protein
MKKGQGLPLNVIVIAAIALIVLVVLIIIFTNRIGGWGKGVDDAAVDYTKVCAIPGTSRECVDSATDCEGETVLGEFSDCAKEFGQVYVCCE